MGITHPKFKAAVVQAAPVWLDLDSSSVISTIRSVTTALSRGKSRRQRATTGSPSCWVFPSETEAASTSLSG